MDLARSPILEIPGTPTVAEALGRMRRDPASRLDSRVAREVAEREGIGAVIYGEAIRVVAFMTEPRVIHQILEHLRRQASPARHSRAPPRHRTSPRTATSA